VSFHFRRSLADTRVQLLENITLCFLALSVCFVLFCVALWILVRCYFRCCFHLSISMYILTRLLKSSVCVTYMACYANHNYCTCISHAALLCNTLMQRPNTCICMTREPVQVLEMPFNVLWQVPGTRIVTAIQKPEILYHYYATSEWNRYVSGNEYVPVLEPRQPLAERRIDHCYAICKHDRGFRSNDIVTMEYERWHEVFHIRSD
jgi:hypothetical protein